MGDDSRLCDRFDVIPNVSLKGSVMSKSVGKHRFGTPGLVYTPVTWEPLQSHRIGVDVATTLGRHRLTDDAPCLPVAALYSSHRGSYVTV
jgi:hypothetical protein